MIADIIEQSCDMPGNKLYTSVQPSIIRSKPSVVYEKNLHESCPILFHFIQNFAYCNDLILVEDRRTDRVEVNWNRRRSWAPMVALGAGMMLQSMQCESASLVPSTPHELRSGEAELEADEVIDLSARVRDQGRFTELESNAMLIPVTSNRSLISHYELELEFRGGRRPFSYFEGESFHALGYLSGDQIVLDVLVGGGPFVAPGLWGSVQHMARDPVQLQYMPGSGGNYRFGVFKVTYYLESKR